MDWSKVEKEHIQQAIEKFINERPEYPEPHSYYLLYEGEKLPSKYIRGMAYSIATGEAFDLSRFNGGEETVRFFERHGYMVVQDTEKKKYSVNDSVWIAVAVMSYEKYYAENVRNIAEYSFVQSDIRKRAEEINGAPVEAARTSQWVCGDHENHTYSYLRAVGVKRRLSFPGEFNGDNEQPTSLNLEDSVVTSLGEIAVQQLLSFVHKEYAEMESQVVKEVNIDYIGVLDYLRDNSEQPYSNPEADGLSAEEKTRLLDLKQKGQRAVSEMKKMADIFGKIYGLDKCLPMAWLDGSNTKTRKYLWAQLKYSAYADNPISVSIFVEKNGTTSTRYRISLEIKNDGTDKKTMAKYHSFLDLPLDKESGFVYVAGSNEWGYPDPLSDSQEVVKQKVATGSLRKVQLSKYVKSTADSTNVSLHEEVSNAIAAIIPYYEYVIDYKKNGNAWQKIDSERESQVLKKVDVGLNTILYGPPGTGKTYNTVVYAVAICGEDGTLEEVKEKAKADYKAVKARYDELKAAGRIAFTTFHQSYGYEEFIEGIRPVMSKENDDLLDDKDKSLKYKIEPGVFKKFCDKAKTRIIQKDSQYTIRDGATVWNVHLGENNSTEFREECFEEGTIRIGWEDWPETITQDTENLSRNTRSTLLYFQDEMEVGDIVVSFRTVRTIDAIGVITGPCEYDETNKHYPRKRNVKWLVSGKEMEVYSLNGDTRLDINSVRPTYIKVEDVLKLVGDTSVVEVEEETRPFVFIIDEINRGNMSKIFGELITLIENTKRAGMDEEANAILPYSGISFSVPANVYILGTMNTADRSIALMDTALRRRFQFIEMMPDTDVLAGIEVEGLNIAAMLNVINERIKFLYDREHTIGHAFFIGLRKEPTVAKLASIFAKSVIPLLQEYFYEDYQKIQLVLGDNGKSDAEAHLKFIKDTKIIAKDIFVGSVEDVIDLPEKKYEINPGALLNIESYKKIGPGL